jgi:hypothetical protein
MMKKYGRERDKNEGMGLGEAYKALGDLYASVRKIFEPQNSSIEAQLEAQRKTRSTLMSTLMNNRPLDHYMNG